MGLIRLLLALAVLLAHSPGATVHFVGGAAAVQGFFIISGFYMAHVLSGKYRDRRLFWTNRLLRLAPAYFAMMLIAGVALAFWGITVTASPQTFATALSNPLSAMILIVENIVVIGQHWLYWFTFASDGSLIFDPSGAQPSDTVSLGWQALIVPQSWSLSLELIFYALVPWLVRLPTRILLMLIGASIAIRLIGLALPVDYPLWQGRLFVTTAFLFLLGMVAQRLLPWVERQSQTSRWATFALLLAAIILLPLTQWPGEAQRWALYFSILIGTPAAFSLTHHSALDRWIGTLSYPLYLTQLFAIAVVLTLEWPTPVWSIIGLSFALSLAIMLFIERPMDRWRQRRAGCVNAA